MTPFNLIQSLRSWFFARDGDIVLTSGRKLAVTSANIEITGGNLVITTGNITITGTVDGINIADHAADVDAHHNQSHVLATGTALGGDHTISGAADGQVLRASSSTAARFDPLAHADLGSVTADQHHNESHNVASHSDTSATGSELNTLTDGSDASSLHDHDGRYFQESEFTGSPGANSLPLESTAAGLLTLVDVYATSSVRAGSGITVGATTATPGDALIMLQERATPGTPASGYVYIWAATTGRVYSKDDTGTVRELSNV